MSSAFHQIICTLVFFNYLFFLSEAIAAILKSPVSVVSVKAHAIAAGSLCTIRYTVYQRLSRDYQVNSLATCAMADNLPSVRTPTVYAQL